MEVMPQATTLELARQTFTSARGLAQQQPIGRHHSRVVPALHQVAGSSVL